MIKSLFESDENQPEEIKTETIENPPKDLAIDKDFETHFAGIEPMPTETNEPAIAPENLETSNDTSQMPAKTGENPPVESLAYQTDETLHYPNSNTNIPEISIAETFDETINVERFSDERSEIKAVDESSGFHPPVESADEPANFNFSDETSTETANYELPAENLNEETDFHSPVKPEDKNADFETPEAVDEQANFELPFETKTETAKTAGDNLLFMPPAEPESFAETARQSGLAYAAAITLFASVIFMLIVGWFADLLLGSSPWGIIIGIVLGAAIGFIQFFRMTSQIFKK
jgi:F0F1-type ATP synthase assembly protein I